MIKILIFCLSRNYLGSDVVLTAVGVILYSKFWKPGFLEPGFWLKVLLFPFSSEECYVFSTAQTSLIHTSTVLCTNSSLRF